MELKIEKVRDLPLRKEITALWQSCAGRLECLIDTWVKDEREIHIVSGWENEDRSKRRAYIIFRENSLDIAEAFFTAEEIYSCYPEIEKLIPPAFHPISKFEIVEEDGDQEFYERRDRMLEIVWDENLYETTVSLENAAKLAFGYVLSSHGEVEFSKPSEYLFEEVQEPTYKPEDLVSVTARQIDDVSGVSRHESLIAVRGIKKGVPAMKK